MTEDKLDQLPKDDLQLLATFRQMSPAQRQAMLELAERWAKGTGASGGEEGLAWVQNRATEIEAEGGGAT